MIARKDKIKYGEIRDGKTLLEKKKHDAEEKNERRAGAHMTNDQSLFMELSKCTGHHDTAIPDTL